MDDWPAGLSTGCFRQQSIPAGLEIIKDDRFGSIEAAEIYVTILTGFGLGQLLHFGRELNSMEQVIGVMAIIVVIGLLADKILFSPWERFLHRRWGTDTR